jgi:hypothetical protein
MANTKPRDEFPDVRDGLTQRERSVLHVLHRVQAERGGRSVPMSMLYGYVVEVVDISVQEFQTIVTRLVGRRVP